MNQLLLSVELLGEFKNGEVRTALLSSLPLPTFDFIAALY